jgi:hypothetical protein
MLILLLVAEYNSYTVCSTQIIIKNHIFSKWDQMQMICKLCDIFTEGLIMWSLVTILKRAWSANFKMVWYVLLRPLRQELKSVFF